MNLTSKAMVVVEWLANEGEAENICRREGIDLSDLEEWRYVFLSAGIAALAKVEKRETELCEVIPLSSRASAG